MGDGAADVSWLSGRLGDVYPHETATTHGRRLLSHNPPCALTGETLAQFRRRPDRVEEHMNPADFGKDAESPPGAAVHARTAPDGDRLRGREGSEVSTLCVRLCQS